MPSDGTMNKIKQVILIMFPVAGYPPSNYFHFTQAVYKVAQQNEHPLF